jgi:hypothetical protein
MKKKKKSETKGHKAKGGRKAMLSRRPKPSAPPQDTDLDVDKGGNGFHNHCITWHNNRTVDVTVEFYTSQGCPLTPANSPSFPVSAGRTKKTPVRGDACGEYTYRTCPPPEIRPRGGDPTVIIQ